MTRLEELRSMLSSSGTSERAKASSSYFKTGKGQYGFGDKFLGVTMPQQRVIAKKFNSLTLADIEKLLLSEFHEERMVGLLILLIRFRTGDNATRKLIFDFYVDHIKCVNNWDLVDVSAPSLIGEYLLDRKITLILSFAKNDKLWIKRIAVLSTFAFIHSGNPSISFLVADLLLDDREDLIQKAVGWMLREVGKQISEPILEEYLKVKYQQMGRVTLRYAIEHFPPEKRKQYLAGQI